MFRRMPIIVIAICLCAHRQIVVAQGPAEKLDTEVVKKIREEGLKRSAVMETISFLTDVHGPRLTAAPQTRVAAEWTKERLLRQPIFLGVRDDKPAHDVTIEGVSLQRHGTGEMKNDAA